MPSTPKSPTVSFGPTVLLQYTKHASVKHLIGFFSCYLPHTFYTILLHISKPNQNMFVQFEQVLVGYVHFRLNLFG